MITEFSKQISEIIFYSKEEAGRLQNDRVIPPHLLLGIIRKKDCLANKLLSEQADNIYAIKAEIEDFLKQVSDPGMKYNPNIAFSEEATEIIKASLSIAEEMGSNTADSEHLLLSILARTNNITAEICNRHNVSYSSVMAVLKKVGDKTPQAEQGQHSVSSGIDREDNMFDEDENFAEEDKTTSTARPDNASTPTVDKYCTDLTKAAAEGKLDPLVGREKEIQRVAQILCRRKKNNPVLIGEPGVGKSAIVEGLALRIAEHTVSPVLQGKRIMSLDLAALVAGTKYRGQFEERIKSLTDELKSHKDIILFIDELHTIVGSGSAAGSMDAANILKPALARGEIQCIGATTIEEYRKVIEKDGALERRFQKILVEETTMEETEQIIVNIKDRYEEFHNVTYTPEALKACVTLSAKYISGRQFPDKAIDILDEAGSRCRISNMHVPDEIKDKEKLIDELNKAKNDAISRQDYEHAISYRDKAKEVQQELDAIKKAWKLSMSKNRQTVSLDTIETIVSEMSGVPVQRLQQSEKSRLLHMGDALKQKVIGQDNAIGTVAKSIIRNRVGIGNSKKPIGVFMFLGPTGVGKTYLVKELAKFMFGSEDSLIRIDMSEYTEKYNVSRLVGAPPGYVGYEEGGQLTEKVRKKPYSIILLDEIEKAHADVYNVLLQIMDEGRLTDSYGRTVDFKNTIIIMTSNSGSRQLREFPSQIGFASSNASGQSYKDEVINKALHKTFSPEFLNRLDEIVIFNSLDKAALDRIVDLEMQELKRRMAEMGYALQYGNDVIEQIIAKGYDVQYGARPIKRAIQNMIEDKISMALLEAEDDKKTISLTSNAENKEIIINIS